MRLEHLPARPDWSALVTADGVPYHTVHGVPYWAEGKAVALTGQEIERLTVAGEEIARMYDRTMDHIARDVDRLRMWFPRPVAEAVAASWRQNPPTLFGRLDLVMLPDGGIKLYEYNAQTPTSLPESALAQWNWLLWQQEQGNVPSTAEQFSDAFEHLVEQWRVSGLDRNVPVFVATLDVSDAHDGGEDMCNAALMCDAAQQAGFEAVLINLNTDVTLADSGPLRGRFVFTPELDEHWFAATPEDHQRLVTSLVDQPIQVMFMLFPWEWILLDSDGAGPAPFAEALMHLVRSGQMVVIEPLYSVMKSSKLMLPLLCELYPNSPYLLDASFGDVTVPMKLNGYVKKPAFGREGANIEIRLPDGSLVADTGGAYGRDGLHILQEYCPMPELVGPAGDAYYPVLGVWVVGGHAVGLSIRSVSGDRVSGQHAPVTDNSALFMPHFFTREGERR